jgi:hypothetical protein
MYEASWPMLTIVLLFLQQVKEMVPQLHQPITTSTWSDPDVFYGAPEYRRYTWTNTNVP